MLATLHRLLDPEWMREAQRQTRRDGDPGIDRVTAADCERDVEASLTDLLGRIKSGSYHAAILILGHLGLMAIAGAGNIGPVSGGTMQDVATDAAMGRVHFPVSE